jgi:hypothetical protein
VALVWVLGVLGLVAVYGTFGGEAVSLGAEPLAGPQSTSKPLPAEHAGNKAALDFGENFRSFAAWDGFRTQQSAGFFAELPAPGATLLVAEEPSPVPEPELAKQRQDREIRTKAAQAARQKAEQGGVQTAHEELKPEITAEQRHENQDGGAATLAQGSRPRQSAAAPSGERLSRALQTHLKRVGCEPGKVNGEWNADSRRALEAFISRTGAKLAVNVATPEAVAAVKARTARVCPESCQRGHEDVKNDRCREVETRSGRPGSHRAHGEARAEARSLSGTPALPGASDEVGPLARGGVSGGKNCFTLNDHVFCK